MPVIDPVFNKETVTKGALYARLKAILMGAGWQNVTRSVTDYDVFYSKGESGNKELYFQITDLDLASSNASFTTSTSTILCARLINSYSQSTGCERDTTAELFKRLYLGIAQGNAIAIDVELELYWSCNKNRFIFFVRPPMQAGAYVFIGLPDNAYLTEKNGNGLLIACSCQATTAATSGYQGVAVTSPSYTKTTSSIVMATDMTNPPAEYSLTDVRQLCEIVYESTTEGVRGKLDGTYYVFTDPTAGVKPDRTCDGDILVDNTTGFKYRIAKCGAIATGWGSAIQNSGHLNAQWIALRVE